MNEHLSSYGHRVDAALVTVIRRELGERAWSLRELARRIEASPQYVSSRFNDDPKSGKRREFTVSDVIRIGSALGIPGAELVRRAKEAVDGDGGATVTPIRHDRPAAPAVQKRAARKKSSKPKMGDE